MLEQACLVRDVKMSVSSDGWVVTLNKGERKAHIVGAEFGFNDQAAAALAKDKVATSTVLTEAAIDHVEHRLIKSRGEAAFDRATVDTMLEAGPCVLKPLLGGAGHLVSRVDSTEHVARLVSGSDTSAWALSPLIDAEYELRVIILDGQVQLVHKKINPVVRGGLKYFNLSKGATARLSSEANMDRFVIDLARASAAALNLRLAAIDILVSADGSSRVLEANAAFSLVHFAKTNPAAYEQAAGVYDRLVTALFER